MIKIGEFAKLGCVSVKTLRHYDRLNLLHPAHIDVYSGYRYYELNQLKRLNEILLFKLMGFSLENIETLLTHRTPEEVSEMLTQQESRLREQQNEISERLLWLHHSRTDIINARDALKAQVLLKHQPEMELVVLQNEVQRADRSAFTQHITRMRTALNNRMEQEHGRKALPFWALIECTSEDPDSDQQCFEVGIPTTINNLEAPFRQRIFPTRTDVLSLLYNPKQYPSEEARYALFDWTQRSAYHFDGPFIELHYQDSEKVWIELQRQVARSLPPQLSSLNERNKTMDVTIKKLPAQLYIGKTRQFTMETTAEISKFWDEFNNSMDAIVPLIIPDGQPNSHCLGLCWEENKDGYFNYAPAFPLKDNKVTSIPEGFEIILLPEQDYVIVPAPGEKDNIGKAYSYAFETWLPQQTEWEHDRGKPDFEWYDEDFNNFQEDSILWIYIPIKRKA